MTKSQFKEIIENCNTRKDIMVKLKIPANGTYTRLVNDMLIKHDLTFISNLCKYKTITKTCPVCSTEFETKEHSNKTTCSYSCSNTHFRSGVNNGNWTGDNYRAICFEHHEKKCIVCGEDKIVAVHHLDENHSNNDPANLIPLCPTHHQYWHSRYKYLVEPIVTKYVSKIGGH